MLCMFFMVCLIKMGMSNSFMKFLISLEMSSVSLYYLVNINMVSISMSYMMTPIVILTILVCESILGLSLLIMSVRTHLTPKPMNLLAM